MELVTECLNCGSRYRWDNEVSTTGMPDCPACGFNNQTGKQGGEKTGKYPEGLAGALLHRGSRGDDAVEELLTLASQGGRNSLAIVEETLVFLAGKKLTYFTPGPRVQTGAEVYGSKSYGTLLKSLTSKAREKCLLDNATETQDEIIRITGHIEYNDGSFFNKIREAGGQEALKIVQLLDTHVKVQARLIHMGVLSHRESIMEFDRVLAIFKFGKREHIDQFVHEGHIYMNSLKYFKTLEGDLQRTDKYEGASYNLQADGAKLRMEQNGKWVDVATIRNQIVSSDGNEHLTKVFCMYALLESKSKGLVDPRNFEFGDTFVILKDGDEFLRRVYATAKKENIVLKQGCVEYIDKAKYNGAMGVFRKFSEFAYQSEFRLSVVTEKETPFSLRVGDISDISMVGPFAELNKRIKISSK
jgi:hypothetical protein